MTEAYIFFHKRKHLFCLFARHFTFFSLVSWHMHIFIDIRSWENPDPIMFWYAKQWGKMWKKYHPHDALTYLVSTSEMVNLWDSFFLIPSFRLFSRKIQLRQKNTGNMIFRMVNFSRFPPYDPTIPTISHITDNAPVLYDFYSLPFLKRKQQEWKTQAILKNSHSIIVPDISIWHELVELFGFSEERISVLPFLPFTFDAWEDRNVPFFLQNRKYFIYDGSYGSETGIIKLLVEWGKYLHNTENQPLLILLWLAWENLSLLTQTLRSFELSESVKYLWHQNEIERDILYKNASWWIYVGEYYSGWAALSAAKSYGLPLLLSDIPFFQWETAFFIHPKKLDTLHSFFSVFPQKQIHASLSFDEESLIWAYRKILSES